MAENTCRCGRNKPEEYEHCSACTTKLLRGLAQRAMPSTALILLGWFVALLAPLFMMVTLL